MPIGKGYKASMKRGTSTKKAGVSAKGKSLPSGRVSGKASKGKFNAGAYSKMHKKVFGLAKKEQMGNA